MAIARRFADAHPEWWVLAIVVISWAALSPTLLLPIALHHKGAISPDLVASVAQSWLGWCLMTTAMMLPIVLWDVRFVFGATPRSRSMRSGSLFVLSFLIPWFAVGGIVAAADTASVQSTPWIGFALVAGACMWEFGHWKRSALLSCRRRPAIRPIGRDADLSALRFGMSRAVACLMTCGPAMLAIAVAMGHAMAPMAVLGSGMFLQATARRGHQFPGLSAGLLAAVGGGFLVGNL